MLNIQYFTFLVNQFSINSGRSAKILFFMLVKVGPFLFEV
jgi:hypothetical protein